MKAELGRRVLQTKGEKTGPQRMGSAQFETSCFVLDLDTQEDGLLLMTSLEGQVPAASHLYVRSRLKIVVGKLRRSAAMAGLAARGHSSMVSLVQVSTEEKKTFFQT